MARRPVSAAPPRTRARAAAMTATSDSGKALLRAAYAEPAEATAYTAPGWGGGGGAIATAEAVDADSAAAASAAAWDADVVTAQPASAAAAAATSFAPPPALGAAYDAYDAYDAYGAYGAGGAAAGDVGAATILRYNAVLGELQNLAHVDGDIRATLQEISTREGAVQTLKGKLRKARKDLPKAEARLQRNEHPRFFHYMQVNRKDKVQRLDKLVNDIKSSEERWVGEKHEAERALAESQQAMQKLRGLAATRDQLDAERTEIFDRVVASVPSTPRLSQIEANISSQKSALSVEQSLLTQVNEVLALVQQAQRLYAQSMGMLDQAQRMNNTAQFSNILGAGRGGGGLEFYETANQFQRDQLINQSQQPADQAYQLVSRAWASFPEEVRRRYPGMTSQIGHVPLPRLRAAHFGNTLAAGMVFGDIGDAINNGMATGKIRENLGIVQRCVQIVDQQLALVVALRNTINMDVDKMTTNLQALGSQRAQERDSIFASVSASLTGRSTNYSYGGYM